MSNMRTRNIDIMGVRRHGQGGHLLPGNVLKCFCALVVTLKGSVDKNIYALFSQPVVGIWGLRFQTPTGAPFLDPALSVTSSNLPTP